jgi:hypothetical protein
VTGATGTTGTTGATGSTGSSGFVSSVPVTTITANYTIDPTTDFVILCNAAGKVLGVTITLPAAASNVGRMFVVKRLNVSNAAQDRCFLTPVGTSGGTTTVTLDPPDVTATNVNSSFWVISDGTKWWAISAAP